MANKKHKNPFRYLPLDAARVVMSVLALAYRPKKLHVNGEGYKSKIKGGAIIASNHTGYSDPFRVSSCFLHRRMFFLAAKEVMINKFLGFLLKGAGCISIDREQSDINAVRKCVDVLKDGKLLAIFPQGSIKDADEMNKIKSGAVLIALQAGVPIIPMYTQKRKHWWNRTLIVFGDALDCKELCPKRFPSVADLDGLSATLLEKMEECKKIYEQINK